MPSNSNQQLNIPLTIGIAILYIACARAGQYFAIEPANVTPVWLPSGVLLAIALRYGSCIWLGVFLGAFFGNIWAYLDPSDLGTLAASIASASMNGIGDVISIVVAASLIKKFAGTPRILDHYIPLLCFLAFGVVLGPLASAILGVSGLSLFGFISVNDFVPVFTTWWVGDSVGAILLAPFVLSWLYPERAFSTSAIVAIACCTAYSIALTCIVFGFTELPWHFNYGIFLLVPLLFSAMFHFGQRLVFSVQLSVVFTAVVLTWIGYGPFANQETSNIGLIQLQIFAAAFSLVLFTIAILNLEKSLNERFLEQRTQKLEELYRKDPLTNSWNRYRLREFIRGELDRFERDGPSFGVLLFDIDDFKEVNDKFGHIVGDDVLVNIAKVMESRIRSVDFFGRWGGEEFIVIIHDADEQKLAAIANNLLVIIRSLSFQKAGKITISVGGTIARKGDTEMSIIDRADTALYRAKESGKDCAEFI